MNVKRLGFWSRLRERLIPPVPDFSALLTEQCRAVREGVHDLNRFLESRASVARERLEEHERRAGDLRERNMRELNKAFSTPYDREDIYRAIEELEWIASHLSRVPHEMHTLDIDADDTMRALGHEIQLAVDALDAGFSALPDQLEEAGRQADRVARAERPVRRMYEHGLATLFDGADVREIMKRR